MTTMKNTELLKSALAEAKKIEDIFAIAKQAIIELHTRDSIIQMKDLEIQDLHGQKELAETFSNPTAKKIIEEQTKTISQLEKKIMIAEANTKLVLEALDQSKMEIKSLVSKLEEKKLNKESEMFFEKIQTHTNDTIIKTEENSKDSVESKEIEHKILETQKVEIHNYYYGTTYNKFGRYN